MEKTAKKLVTAAVSIILALACVMLVTSCSGVKITPDDDGSITITPNENGGSNVTDKPDGDNTDPDGDRNDSSDDGNHHPGYDWNDPDGDKKDPADDNDDSAEDNNDSTNDKNDSDNESSKPVEVHTHKYTSLDSSEVTYSCTEGGVRVWTCECGDSFNESIEALGHDIRSYEGKAATCEQDGYKDYEKCIRGNCTYTTYETIPALDHNWVALPDVAPTCTADGLTERFKCMRDGCGRYTESVVSALGHIRETVSGVAATCTSDGYTAYEICTREGCATPNLTKSTVIVALGHDDSHYEAKEPTCTEFGYEAFDVCKRCGRSTYTKIEATGHNYDNGYCDCGQVDLAQHTHIWDDGEIVESATCTSAGVMKYTCTDENCKDTKNEEISALGHDNTTYAAKAATCVDTGYNAYEMCNRCGYSTYSSVPALGHAYDSGVITVSPTCTQSGVRTYKCVRDNCSKTVVTEIEKLGHDWGNWFVSIEATCTASGQEQKVCFNDSTHVDNRTITRLGHDWTEYSVIKNSTCTEEGQKKRTCNNDSSHEEIIPIPVIPHDVVLSTGVCNICKKVINPPLETPVITSFNNYVIFWNAVEGADHYEIKIIYNGKEKYAKPDSLSFSLEDCFKECNSLDVYIRAMSPEGSTTPNSDYYMNSYSVNEGTIVNYEGIGKTVNLLNNNYTNYGNTVSIFNTYMFNRLMAGDTVTLNKHYGDNVYTESISEYTNNKTIGIKNKITQNASIGIDKIGKITGGYTFELDENYTQKTYNQTKAVFYDAYYEYRGYQAGIEGYNNPEVLYSLLSQEFIDDAGYVQSGEMSPEAFINKYGTHVITAGIYGAKFNAHYEMIANNETLENTGKIITKATVTAGIESVLKGINVSDDVTSESTLTLDDFVSSNSTDMRTIFEFSAVGGSHIEPSTSISDFAEISERWANSMNSESDYVLIDVPDGSLYFIWDFLDEEHSEAKRILNDYFYARCDEQYDALNSKINGMYKDFYNFDYETGTLTFDLSALQEPETETTSLKDVLYMDGNVEIFNGATGEFRIYPKFSGYDVNKVVFEGGYFTRDSQQGQLIDSYFDSVYIVFDDDWTADRNIEVEFKNFAYHAAAGYAALDFSAVSSESITVIITGSNKMVGSNGITYIDFDKGYNKTNFSGFAGINADNNKSTLTFKGSGSMEIRGGNGINGGSSVTTKITLSDGGIQHFSYNITNGEHGGMGIVANDIKINISGTISVYGGNGGVGAVGSPDDADGEHGGNGTNGGDGAVAIQANTMSIIAGNVEAIGGNGGTGGRGGHGNNKPLAITGSKDGGTGGNGGDGSSAIEALTIKAENSSVIITGGSGGNGGRGGNCGKSGSNGKVGSGGSGGSGAIATTAEIINENSYVESTDGANGSNGASGT